ncbi:hypothetical protein HVY04_01290 [Citrobacter freundii]|uniref:YrhB domain-containing protein n=1 Tax=Citrobacter freundii TaxID=546 RepID=UPI0015E919EA|nr:YrhB domain-containing protein [Citrobacter freundii]QMJ01813.1 hypothetical protein HVY06_01290 [Citrobacter freundii]QMJ10882.1 hypothetical protein HVY04_01290 [Citrobacter freundii]
MISYKEAINKANKYLYDADAPVVITLHGRFAEGWFFCFESREYLETGDNAARLAGNAPFIIDKDIGEIFDLGTAWPLEKYLKDYEESKKTRSYAYSDAINYDN